MSEILSVQESLDEKGYAPVGIDLGKGDLQTAINKYMAFLELDEQFKEATRYLQTDRGDGDFGQYSRVAGNEGERGSVPDNKDIFHFGAQSRQVIESRIRGTLPVDMKNFLDDAEEIFWAAQRTKLNTLRELDTSPGTGLIGIMQPEVGTINDVLRFIAYYPNDEKLAKGHFDRSTATLAIGESHEGLRIAPGQNGLKINANETYLKNLETRLVPIEHTDREAKFFLGAGWNRLPERYKAGHNNYLPLAWHDVIPSEKKVDEKVMRWAVVLFTNPKLEFTEYTVPTQPETRPYKQLGRLSLDTPVATPAA